MSCAVAVMVTSARPSAAVTIERFIVNPADGVT
jgi:hypothetical protein